MRRMNVGLMLAGLVVGLLVGLTGMGAGSLMTPILITVFGIPAGTAVGTDLVYAAITKTFGAARHHQLKNVNRELALWMATGSVPGRVPGHVLALQPVRRRTSTRGCRTSSATP